MQQYPSIGKGIIQDVDYYIFDKLDGSNIRVEFSLKKGFDKFRSLFLLNYRHIKIKNINLLS